MGSIVERKQPNCDRISNLPDNLITHILSFLSTKDAVKTSALSTSWNQQWTLVPLIRFEAKWSSQRFVNFVDRVLLYNVTPLDLFQLTSCFYGYLYQGVVTNNISNWISAAISRHVRQIDVHANLPCQCHLPDSLYSSKTLVVLKLKGIFLFEVPEKIFLQSLKIFHYEACYSVVGESIFRLVSSCPVLEEFQITGQLEKNVKVLNISSPVLKRLILEDLYPEVPDDDPAYELVINTPNLQYLEHSDKRGVPDSYNLNNLHCLDTARFSLYLPDYKVDELIPARSMSDLVVAISNVRALYFEALYYTALPNLELPKFNHLISLELEYCIESKDAGFSLLIAFLQSSPQLECLSFALDCTGEMTWYSTTDVPFCMIYNLKVIKVDSHYMQYSGHGQLLSVLTYFLEKTKCLEELIILNTKSKSQEFIEKVSMLPRASNSCKIVLS